MPEWRSEVRRRLAGLPLDPARADEIVEELAQHLEQRCEELLGHGTPIAEAERLLREELAAGNVLEDELRRLERAAEPALPPLGAPAESRWLGGSRATSATGSARCVRALASPRSPSSRCRSASAPTPPSSAWCLP